MMSNRHGNFIPSCLLILLTTPAWPAVDIKAPQTRVALVQLKSLTLNPTSITGGGTVNGVVTLQAAAGGNGVTVKMVSSAPQIAEVPQSVTVQAGATAAPFIVQTRPVAMNPNVVAPPPSVKISAQIGTASPAVATLTVLPPSLTALTLTPATVGGGSNATGTVTISGPAPSAGMTIALATPSSSKSPPQAATAIARMPQRISMPSQITIPAGAISAAFTIMTRAVSAPETYQVTANWGMFSSKTATLTVTPPEVATVKLCRGQLPAGTPCTGMYTAQLWPGGNPYTGTVNLTAPAPAEGLTVSLSAYAGSKCGEFPSVPSTMSVPGGATSANFSVTTYPGYGRYVVKASSATKFAEGSFQVDSPAFSLVVPASAKGGTPLQGNVQLTGLAMPASCGNRYGLKSSNTTYVQVPEYVDAAQGATNATFPVTTSALPASSAPVTVTLFVTGTYATGGSPHQETLSANLTITP